MAATPGTDARWELYKLLGEPVRLRLLALAREEELSVGELADLLGEPQPNVSRHLAPLRAAGLLGERKQGTRVFVHLADGAARDAVVEDALRTGRSLCEKDGSLARVAEVVRARDAASRAFFAREGKKHELAIPAELPAYLGAFAPLLLPDHHLAVDAGTGDGGLLDVIAPMFDRVVAFDREPAQLDRATERLERHDLKNVALVQGDVDSADVIRAVHAVSPAGADVVFAARFLHHAPKPLAALSALAALARPGGAVVVIDYARHEDESMREQADLWLGFDPPELASLAMDAGLVEPYVRALPRPRGGATPDSHLPWQVLVARRPTAQVTESQKSNRQKQEDRRRS